MKSKIKIFITIIIVLIQSLCLTGCWNSREINSLAFVTAMGFDKTETGILVTIQVMNPRAIASQKAVNEAPIVVYTEEGQDTFEIIRKMITHSARKLNGTHIETIVFGEEYAKDGISDVLDFFSREHQNRSNLYFVVAKGTTATNVLSCLTKLETSPSVKLRTSLDASSTGWAATNAIQLIELINSVISDGTNPALTGVEILGDIEENQSIDELKKSKAGMLQILDLAVFKKDKFVGWLDEDESKGRNYIVGKVLSTIAYVEDPSIGKITLEVTGTKSKQKAILQNGKLAFNVDVKVKANIVTVAGGLDITKAENVKKVEKLAADKLTMICYKSLEKAQKDLGSDVFGFGGVVHRTYPKLWKTIKDDWNNEFTSVPVTVNATVKIEGTGTISKSFFMKEKEEK